MKELLFEFEVQTRAVRLDEKEKGQVSKVQSNEVWFEVEERAGNIESDRW